MITGKYIYSDIFGNPLYWKERIEPARDGSKKEFVFYHGNRCKSRGCEAVLYHLPDVARAKAIIINEGEKQADLLRSWGLAGTSLDSGAGSKLTPAMIEVLTGKRVAILRDNDEPGLMYASRIADALHGKCESVRVVLLSGLPDKGDVCDWQGNKAQLLAEIKATPEWIPTPKPEFRIKIPTKITLSSITPEMIEAASNYPIAKLIDLSGNKACCIKHKEKTPSMVLFPNNRVHCYGCGFNGNAIDVLRVRDNINFPDAVRFLQ